MSLSHNNKEHNSSVKSFISQQQYFRIRLFNKSSLNVLMIDGSHLCVNSTGYSASEKKQKELFYLYVQFKAKISILRGNHDLT